MRYVGSILFVSNTHTTPDRLCLRNQPRSPNSRDISTVIPWPSSPCLLVAQHKSRPKLGGGALHGLIWGLIFECASVGTVLLAVKFAAIVHGWIAALIP